MRVFETAERSSTKSMGRLASIFIAAALALGMSAFASLPEKAHAAQKSAYTYNVRVFSGEQGTFKTGGDCYQFNPLPAGTTVSLQQGDIQINKDSQDKYYVKGWKLGGKDDVTKKNQNNDSNLISNVRVDSDMDLVICYGVLVDAVGYTVRYVDQSGADLYPAESFRGNVGDRPVLAYRYIEGFIPQAYNLTGELYRNEAENIYVFRYTPVANPEDVTIQLPTEVTTVTAPAAGGAGAAAPVTLEDAPAVAVEEPANEEFIADDGTPLAQPADIEDIRDDDTPMASANMLAKGPTLGDDAGMLFGQNPLATGLGVAMILLIIVAIALLLTSKKHKRKMVATAASQAIASGYTVDPASLVEEEVDVTYMPANDQAMYIDPTQHRNPQQPINPQQYAGQPGAQQYQAPYPDQQYGHMQNGGQMNGQYDQYGQYGSQFGNPDDR